MGRERVGAGPEKPKAKFEIRNQKSELLEAGAQGEAPLIARHAPELERGNSKFGIRNPKDLAREARISWSLPKGAGLK